MEKDEELTVHDLAIARTRPPMMPGLGMPWVDAIVFLVAGVDCIVLSHTQFLIPLGAVFIFSLGLYKRDYNAGRCFVCWLSETGRLRIASIFGWLVLLRPQGREAAEYAYNAQAISPSPHRTFRGISG
jgi:type IV secretory pathway VirB3-like protein